MGHSIETLNCFSFCEPPPLYVGVQNCTESPPPPAQTCLPYPTQVPPTLVSTLQELWPRGRGALRSLLPAGSQKPMQKTVWSSKRVSRDPDVVMRPVIHHVMHHSETRKFPLPKPSPPRRTPHRAQVSAGVDKPSMNSECASGCTWPTARATARLWDSRPRSSQTGQVIQGLR